MNLPDLLGSKTLISYESERCQLKVTDQNTDNHLELLIGISCRIDEKNNIGFCLVFLEMTGKGKSRKFDVLDCFRQNNK